MIRIPKKLSSKITKNSDTPRFRYARAILFAIGLIVLYGVFPFRLSLRYGARPFISLFVFYSVNLVIALCVLRNTLSKKKALEIRRQDLREAKNLLEDEFLQANEHCVSLKERIKRYDKLQKIIEQINRTLDIETLTETLSSIAFDLLADTTGVCILYLFSQQEQRLKLAKTKKTDQSLIIKSKEGDAFDMWVTRHASPLLVEDIRRDFRFDLEKLKCIHIRPFKSLISAPLTIGRKFLGLIRLDDPGANAYTQDDLRLLGTICDIGAIALENAQFYARTQDLAIHDELTSLYTKGHFLERLKEELLRSVRYDTAFSLLMMDIDYFKKYNDTYGHTAGDIVLRKLSDVIVTTLKEFNPLIARFGGEEFSILLIHIDKKRVLEISEKLRAAVEKTTVSLRGNPTAITVSVGVAFFPEDAREENELIFKADQALYKAKRSGRNRVCTS